MVTKSFPIVGTVEVLFDAICDVCNKYSVDGKEVIISSNKELEEAVFPYEMVINALIDMQKIKWYYMGSIAECHFSFTGSEVIANYTYPGAKDNWDLTKGVGKMIYEKACELLTQK